MYFALALFCMLCLSLGSVVSAEHEALSKRLHPFRPRPAPRKPIHISDRLYRQFQIYTNYTSASYKREGRCPHPPYGSILVDYININSTSTQGVLFRNDEARELIYAFPGTDSKRDQQTDDEAKLTPLHIQGVTGNRCRRCRAYRGVQIAWRSITNRTIEALDRQLEQHPLYKVTITGHSLGGAIATVATASLRGLGYPIAKTMTFGQPRVGNAEFAHYIDRINGATYNIPGFFYRVTHANDGVPQAPAIQGGWRHSMTEYWERNKKGGGQSAHRTFRCYGQEPPNCNLGTHAPSIVDHAHGYYSGIKIHSGTACGK